MKAQVYLLAAGQGLRAGGPKAWLDYKGRPLLERQLDFLLGFIKPHDVAVSIQSGWAGRCSALNPEVKWAAVDPAAAPMASFLSLLKVAPMRDWAFLYHVDMPVWERDLFENLRRRAQGAGPACDAVVPVYEGRKGHPVLLSPRDQAALAALDPERDRLDHWLRSRNEETLDVPFACVLENWNHQAPAR